MDLAACCPPLASTAPGAAVPAASRRRWQRAVLALLAVALLLAMSVRAWDAQRIVRSAQKYGPLAVSNATALEQVMAGVVGKDDATRLKAVNDFYNQRLAYREDIDNWGVMDYWASPLESLGKGAGDCEDYAIGKYFTLVALGMPHAKLRLVYVRASMEGSPQGFVPHMVLAYYPTPEAEPLVLDNLQPDIRSADARPDLSPVFSFNAEGLWQGVGSVRASGDPLTRLSKWREALMRARQDGFQ